MEAEQKPPHPSTKEPQQAIHRAARSLQKRGDRMPLKHEKKIFHSKAPTDLPLAVALRMLEPSTDSAQGLGQQGFGEIGARAKGGLDLYQIRFIRSSDNSLMLHPPASDHQVDARSVQSSGGNEGDGRLRHRRWLAKAAKNAH